MLLDPRPGEHVADLCAAPGGKTMQIAAAGATVTAIDLSAARLDRVRENLSRTGLNATLVIGDALNWRPDAPLDAVLLDAPCSATGTIRRHPDVAWTKRPDDIVRLAARAGVGLEIEGLTQRRVGNGRAERVQGCH